MLRDGLSELSGDGGGRVVAPADLAQGLSFLRASNLQVMRLQLAAQRQDRRGVMAAIDELVVLDRELGRFIESIPGGRPLIGAAQPREIMEQRLILSRGKIGPAFGVPARPTAVEAPAPCEEATGIGEDETGQAWASRLLILFGLCCLAALAILYGLTGSLTAPLELLR